MHTLSRRTFLSLTPLPFSSHQLFADEPVKGDTVIRRKLGDSEIVITTTNRLAGAIHSLTWNGQEFIDSVDHGRQLQSASSFDCAQKIPFWAECYNPTEAGSRADGTGKTSTSRLLKIKATETSIETRTQMAFWLKPTEKSDNRPALNKEILSDHILTKSVTIGYQKFANVLDYKVTFAVPKEHHTYGQFEALTGYMPKEFSSFYCVDLKTGKLGELSDGPGEQKHPIILSNPAKTHAMGIYSPDQPSKGYEGAGYGRFRFKAEKVVKWNCVFRVKNPDGIAQGDYSYQMYVIIGDLDEVQKTLLVLAKGR